MMDRPGKGNVLNIRLEPGLLRRLRLLSLRDNISLRALTIQALEARVPRSIVLRSNDEPGDRA